MRHPHKYVKLSERLSMTQPQQEYIITEDQMKRQRAWDLTLSDMREIHDEIRSRPLSEELKKERNKLVVEMLSAIPNEGMSVWEERGYLKFINSFRCAS